MAKEMRRKQRQISEEQAYKILSKGEYGVLSTVNDEDNPYGTPLSYVLVNDKIYYHCAMEGTKLDNIKYNSNVCFTVVGKTQPIYDKQFTTYYESSIVFGKASIIEDIEEKSMALTKLCEKYLPNDLDKLDKALEMSLSRTCVFKVEIDSITGKEKKAIK